MVLNTKQKVKKYTPKRCLCLLVWAMTCLETSAQKRISYALDLHTFADNREYNSSPFQVPQTIFGIRTSPTICLQIDSMHQIIGGFNNLFEFGSQFSFNNTSPIIYYQYKSKPTDFFMGSFPRQNLLSQYPLAILTDTLNYYRPNIQGMLLKNKGKWGYQTVWIDWTSRQTTSERETFLFGFSGHAQRGIAFIQNYAAMYHFAATTNGFPNGEFRDNGAITLRMGLDLSKKINHIDSLSINIGYLQSYERNRNTADFRTPKGYLAEAYAQYKRLAIKNTYYNGEGSNLDFGDHFYRETHYNRTDFILIPLKHKAILGKFIYSIHRTKNGFDNQQAFVLRYIFNHESKRN